MTAARRRDRHGPQWDHREISEWFAGTLRDRLRRCEMNCVLIETDDEGPRKPQADYARSIEVAPPR